jgi:hypothetical protein
VFILFGVSKGQQGMFVLDNGTTVLIKTQMTPPGDSKSSLGNIYSSNSGEVVHRIMTDKENKIYFGYDLLVKKQEKSEKFKVSFKPLSKKPSDFGKNNTKVNGFNYYSQFEDFKEKKLPNYPKDIIVEDGDTITLDLLENPKTNTKISDLIKIVYKSSDFGYQFITEDGSAKDFSLEDVMLRIVRPEISINDKKYTTGGSVAGNINWIYIHGKGRFIFSFMQQPEFNFQKIGIIQDNKISFEYNGDKYQFISESPILGQGGKWNLWVMHDPTYQPGNQMSEENMFNFGATSNVKYLFDNRR